MLNGWVLSSSQKKEVCIEGFLEKQPLSGAVAIESLNHGCSIFLLGLVHEKIHRNRLPTAPLPDKPRAFQQN